MLGLTIDQWSLITLTIANFSSIVLILIGFRYSIAHPDKVVRDINLKAVYAHFFLMQVILLALFYVTSLHTSIRAPFILYMFVLITSIIIGVLYPTTGIAKITSPDPQKIVLFTFSFGIQTQYSRKKTRRGKQNASLIFDEGHENFKPLSSLIMGTYVVGMLSLVILLINVFFGV